MGSFGSSGNFAFSQLYLQLEVRVEERVLALRYVQADGELTRHWCSRSLEAERCHWLH